MTSLFANASSSGRPGLQGQDHGHIRATIYPRSGDALVLSTEPIYLSGRTERDDSPTILSAQIQQAMGQPGNFQISLKMPPGQNLLDQCADDDWVDIELGVNGVYWHVMRGLIDEVRYASAVSGGGVTTQNFMIAGQSFQKVWAQTPMWFSSLFAHQLGLALNQGDNSDTALAGTGLSVPGTIASFLYTYTNLVAQQGRSSVAMPTNMPAVDANFSSTWRQDATEFDDSDAPRQNLLVNNFSPAQSAWDAASQWSDPYFVEMFTAQLPRVSSDIRPWISLGDDLPQLVNSESSISDLGEHYEGTADGLSVRDSAMTVVVRNKPFINVDPENSARVGFDSPWFSLPTLQVTPQSIVSLDIGKNGYERANAFFTATQVISAIGEAPVDAKMLPTWSLPDMRVHGMRILDCVSNYIPLLVEESPGLDDKSMEIRLRARLRDHNMANGIYLNGSVNFGRAYPEVQVGTRLRIMAQKSSDMMTAYIESVSHRFTSGGGWKTSLGITRGYRGPDKDHLKLLQRLRSTYTNPVA